jgi:putative ABC transport system permease protein
MAVQGSLLFSFVQAASRIVDSVNADVWVVSKGTPTFEFNAPVDERIAWLARGVPGVADAGRGLTGFAPIKRADGDGTLIFSIGVEERFRGIVPDIAQRARDGALNPVVIDETDAKTLGAETLPARVEIGGSRADMVASTGGFASFLGQPYVFSSLDDARTYLRYPEGRVSFVAVKIAPGHTAEQVRDNLRARFTNVDVWTADEFSWRSRGFWLIKTGAGGALSLAAILGFLLGLSIVAQTIYSLTADNVEEYATLRALGATTGYIRSIVLMQSLACGALGTVVGLVGVGPFAASQREMVTWLAVPGWIYPAVGAAVATLCFLAALIAGRPAVSAEPGRVFRA